MGKPDVLTDRTAIKAPTIGPHAAFGARPWAAVGPIEAGIGGRSRCDDEPSATHQLLEAGLAHDFNADGASAVAGSTKLSQQRNDRATR